MVTESGSRMIKGSALILLQGSRANKNITPDAAAGF